MNRRDFLKCVGAGTALGAPAGRMNTGTQTSAAKPKWFDRLTTLSRVEGKPNVLFIPTDDQREDTIGALGNPHIKTPNLDKLVRSGLTFTNAYCMGGNAGAVCRTGRNMLLSGQWKLLRYPLINKTQLFDLQNDPCETKDLANDPANAEKVKELLALQSGTTILNSHS